MIWDTFRGFKERGRSTKVMYFYNTIHHQFRFHLPKFIIVLKMLLRYFFSFFFLCKLLEIRYSLLQNFLFFFAFLKDKKYVGFEEEILKMWTFRGSAEKRCKGFNNYDFRETRNGNNPILILIEKLCIVNSR